MITVARVAIAALLFVWSFTAVLAAGATYRLQVAGLACPFCAYGIEKKLSSIPGVTAVETHLKDGSVIVTMKDGATLSKAAARRAVEAAGFTLNGFSRR